MTANADTVRHQPEGPFNQLTKSYWPSVSVKLLWDLSSHQRLWFSSSR